MVSKDLLNSEELVLWIGSKQPSVARKWLVENGVPFFVGKDGGPCTTLQAVNETLLRKAEREELEL